MLRKTPSKITLAKARIWWDIDGLKSSLVVMPRIRKHQASASIRFAYCADCKRDLYFTPKGKRYDQEKAMNDHTQTFGHKNVKLKQNVIPILASKGPHQVAKGKYVRVYLCLIQAFF